LGDNKLKTIIENTESQINQDIGKIPENILHIFDSTFAHLKKPENKTLLNEIQAYLLKK
jgi:hypothetical protein